MRAGIQHWCRLTHRFREQARSHACKLASGNKAKSAVSSYLVGSCHILPFGDRESGTYDASQTPAD
ncbi:hypothetical protein CXQ82_19255 [Pseudomonas sp. S09G 359]|nr:hypothetical protein CXQ82_19255 [Pseudomonas sp. S09G 359]